MYSPHNKELNMLEGGKSIIRTFLCKDADSYVHLRKWGYGEGYELTVADCHRRIELSFHANKKHRRASLAKVSKLKKAIDFLYTELGGV